MKKTLLFLWKYIKNPYILASLAFIVWVGFFDNDNLISRYKQEKEYKTLLQQKEYYETEIQKNNLMYSQLTKDVKAMEKYGREKYLMKKDNEDIYLLIMEGDSAK